MLNKITDLVILNVTKDNLTDSLNQDGNLSHPERNRSNLRA